LLRPETGSAMDFQGAARLRPYKKSCIDLSRYWRLRLSVRGAKKHVSDALWDAYVFNFQSPRTSAPALMRESLFARH
jgi:hypothetical protein